MKTDPLDEKLKNTLKHYYLYLKQCELAGDSKISHTAVKGAINDAAELTNKIIAQIKRDFLQRIEKELPEGIELCKYKNAWRGDKNKDYAVGWNQCRDEVKAILRKMR